MRLYFFSVLLVLLLSKYIYAFPVGQLVSVVGSGGEGPIDVIVCLNGQSPLSCQIYHVTGGYTLQITPAVQSHTYPVVSVELQTQGLVFQSGCASYINNRCIFQASQANPATIHLISTEQHNDSLCLGTNPSCRLFVSRTTTTGNIATGILQPLSMNTACPINDPIARANCICAKEALSHGYGGKWQAWLSTNIVNAKDNIHYNAQTTFTRADDSSIVVANPDTLLTASISYPLSNPPSLVNIYTYTGTNPGGTFDGRACTNWTSASSIVESVIGSSNHTDDSWTAVSTESCNVYDSVYCFESPL